MPVKKKIMTVVLIFMLVQPAADFIAWFFFGKATACGQEIIPRAWAEDELQSRPVTTVMPRGEQKPPGKPQAQKTPEQLPAEQPPQPPSAPLKPEEQKPKSGFFDMLHGGISNGILGSAAWLDSFFADERAVKEENRTYIRFHYDVFIEEKSGVSYQPAFDLRLALPQLEKKTHLVFSSEPATTPSNALASQSITGAEVGPTEERRFTGAVHYFLKSTAEESLILRVGASLKNWSPALFIAPRYRLLIPLKPWDFRFSQEVVYRTDTRWETETQFDLERLLSQEFFFRTNVTGIWKENVHGYVYSVNFLLRQVLGPTHALQYAWSNSYQTRPVEELTQVALSIGYRHSFLRDWLFYEVSPQLRFPRDRNFDVTPGILFRIEMFFGYHR
jgi:hypothetical protein